MKKLSLIFLSLSLVPGLLSPNVGRADTLLIGEISFDSGVSPDGNTFDLYNLTGGQIDPDGIVDNEVFSGSLTVTPVGGSATVYTFSGIDDNGGTIATVLSSTEIASATLSITLGNSDGVNIFDDSGNPAVVDLLGVSDTDLPLNGSTTLTPCDGSGSTCSAAAFSVDTVPVSTSPIPEPATGWLALTGLGCMAAVGRRLRRT